MTGQAHARTARPGPSPRPSRRSIGRGRAGGRGGRRSGFSLIELLVVVAIILVLGSMLAAVLLSVGGAGKVTAAELKSLSMAIEAYRRELGAYPPDDVAALGGSAQYGTSEALAYYLGRRHVKGANVYGPHMRFKERRLTDDDGDGLQECRDPLGRPWLYAENRSHKEPTGINPRSYDLVSPGPDGELGGSLAPATGYVPAASPADKAREEDNVTNW